jgi:predicted unusual protein kinase regulating ubiquinone biosynthesis (AarF/ABC1/UbiB family)
MGLAFRLIRATWLFGIIFASYMIQLGLSRVFDRAGEPPPWLARRKESVDLVNARRLYRGMLKLRGVFIKLGQVLSIMGGFLPRAYQTELESLQDQVPPHPFRDVEKAIVRELGKKPDDVFADIDHSPIAAASLGQVHVAHLKTGEKVAVKILYPGIRDVIKVDMRVLGWAVRVYKWFFPVGNIESVHASLVDLLRRETDYLHEAECMARMAKNFESDHDIICPVVVKELTTRDVLTMSFMEGFKITDFDAYEKNGVDRAFIAKRLVESFYKQLFVDRFFHADPHPGNFLVQARPEGPAIVVLDFGAISEVSDPLIDGAFEILTGLMSQDGEKVLVGFRNMGFVAEEGNKALLEQTVMTYFKKLLKIKDRTPGALMRAQRKDLEKLADPELDRQEIRELMRSFTYPDGWFYVERAAVLAFWLCGRIAPDLDAMSVGVPYVMPALMERQLAKMAAAAEALAPAAPQPPSSPHPWPLSRRGRGESCPRATARPAATHGLRQGARGPEAPPPRRNPKERAAGSTARVAVRQRSARAPRTRSYSTNAGSIRTKGAIRQPLSSGNYTGQYTGGIGYAGRANRYPCP